jgi:FtsP/CotA-like multicopper oxidase with cupredoxin domain
MRKRLGLLVGVMVALVVLTPLSYLWWTSLLPDDYSVMDMGQADYGGGAASAHADHSASHAAVSVADLTADASVRPDVTMSLVAREEAFELASGQRVDGFTLNGRSPGPVLRARQGDLVQVRLVNESVEGGITLHWHGLDVPNAMDGVAGVTQDAVLPGESFTYRFVADQAGSYWYHSHQLSHEQVQGGLLGAIVITPPDDAATDVLDVPALVHIYDGLRTINGVEGDLAVDAAPGERVRVRVINSENGPSPVWVSGAPYRVLAVDGTEVHQPTPVDDQAVLATAGGRVDLGLTMPDDGSGVRVEIAGASAVVLGRGPPAAATPRPESFVDLLHYGTPADLGFDPRDADRQFEYVVDRRPGFIDGRPGMWWTVNGELFPDVPMYMVDRGDVVVMRLENNSGEVHPMHLHGHHAVVLSRDGDAASGSPWWVDSLNVGAGEAYEIAFVADNPGVWMDHCHNLPHAAEGLVAHLMYAGYSTPYRLGGASGNEPE